MLATYKAKEMLNKIKPGLAEEYSIKDRKFYSGYGGVQLMSEGNSITIRGYPDGRFNDCEIYPLINRKRLSEIVGGTTGFDDVIDGLNLRQAVEITEFLKALDHNSLKSYAKKLCSKN